MGVLSKWLVEVDEVVFFEWGGSLCFCFVAAMANERWLFERGGGRGCRFVAVVMVGCNCLLLLCCDRGGMSCWCPLEA